MDGRRLVAAVNSPVVLRSSISVVRTLLLLVVLVVVVLVPPPLGRGAHGLTCNLCNNADLIEDCFINHELCRPDYVCFVKIQYFTLTKNDYTTKTMKLYSMGCQHFHLCRDRRTHGSGAYGYGTQQYQCCCTDFCHEPDGVGRGRHDLCPALWKNRTSPTSAASLRQVNAAKEGTLLLLPFFSWSVIGVL